MWQRTHPIRRVVFFSVWACLLSLMVGGIGFSRMARGEAPSCDLSRPIAQFVSIRAAGSAAADKVRREHIAEELERCALLSPDNRLAETALLDAAILWHDSHQLTGENTAAMKTIYLAKEIQRRYPGSSSEAEVTLLRAQVEWRLGNAPDARALAQQVKRSHHRTTYGKQAALLLKTFEQPYQSAEPLGQKNLPLVVLDPGHGGEDRGAVGPGGIVEKDIVLAVATRVAALIRQEGRMNVALTRDSDTFLPLAERTRRANERGAALFVSFHTNASAGRQPRGLTTYYLDNADDSASRALAERENSSVRLGGDPAHADLAVMLSSLIQSGKLEDSVVLAHALQRQVIGEVKAEKRWSDAGVRDLGVKNAPFFVLVGAHMPCVLIELFFIDNKHDAALLVQEEFRETLVRGIVKGISTYLAEAKRGRRNPHSGYREWTKLPITSLLFLLR